MLRADGHQGHPLTHLCAIGQRSVEPDSTSHIGHYRLFLTLGRKYLPTDSYHLTERSDTYLLSHNTSRPCLLRGNDDFSGMTLMAILHGMSMPMSAMSLLLMMMFLMTVCNLMRMSHMTLMLISYMALMLMPIMSMPIVTVSPMPLATTSHHAQHDPTNT